MRFWPEGPLVDADWLKAHLGVKAVAVLDCRFELADPAAGERAYRAGHIPGAQYVHLERDLSGPRGERGGRHPLPTPAAFAAAMGSLGVGDDSMVVVYDQDASMAPRAWWLLRYMGHDAVALLDGGIDAWRQAGGDVEREVREPVARAFTPRPRPDWTVTIEAVRGLGQDSVLIDARAGERYRGEVEPLDPRAGHIPGARSAPFKDGMDASGRWLDADDQASRFDRLAPPGAPIVAYCGSGVTACANLLALEIAGRKGARLYPGSFSDWSSRPELPVATGDTP
jgi:thiosulfate/3-mercaptopyruvate sulfurtransferase